MKKEYNKLRQLVFSMEMGSEIDRSIFNFLHYLFDLCKEEKINTNSLTFYNRLLIILKEYKERDYFNNFFVCPTCKSEYMWKLDKTLLDKFIKYNMLDEWFENDMYICSECDLSEGLNKEK